MPLYLASAFPFSLQGCPTIAGGRPLIYDSTATCVHSIEALLPMSTEAAHCIVYQGIHLTFEIIVCVVGNIHEYAIPESSCHPTALNAHIYSHPCAVSSLLFVFIFLL